MRKFLILLRLSLRQTLFAGLSGSKKKAKVASAATAIIIYAVVGVLIFLSMGAAYAGMVFAAEDGESGVSVYAAVTVANALGTAITLFLGTMGLATHVFKCRDFDFLMSLPVTPAQTLWSKLVGQYVTLLFYSTMFTLPSYIVIFTFGGAPVTFSAVLSMVLNLFLLPAIPLAVSVVLAFFVSLIPENNVLGKVFSTLLSLGLIGFYMWFFYGGDGMTQLMLNPAVTNTIKKIYFPLGLLDRAVGGDLVALLLYVAASAGICAVAVGLLSFAYFPIIRRRRQGGGKRRKLEKTDIKASRIGAALYAKEIKKYFGTTTYVVNTIIGPLLFVGGSLYFTLSGSAYLALLSGDSRGLAVPALVLFQTLTLGMGCTTSASVSLEGKSLWILRSAPVAAKDVFAAKAGVCLTVLLPCSLAGSLILVFGLGLDAVSCAAVMLSSVILPFVIAELGLLANLRFPRLDFVNEAQAVKQGAAPVIGMFLPMLIMLPFAGVAFMLSVYGVEAAGTVCPAVVLASEVAFLAVVSALLATKGKKLYEKL